MIFLIQRGRDSSPDRVAICVFFGTMEEAGELCQRMDRDDPHATVPNTQYYWRQIDVATLNDYLRFLSL